MNELKFGTIGRCGCGAIGPRRKSLAGEPVCLRCHHDGHREREEEYAEGTASWDRFRLPGSSPRSRYEHTVHSALVRDTIEQSGAAVEDDGAEPFVELEFT